MHSFFSKTFTVFYAGSCVGDVILLNTEMDENRNVTKKPTLEIETSIEEILRVVNQYIDLHGYNDYTVPIKGSLKSDNNKSETIDLSVKELVSFLSEMALRREINRLEGMSWEESAEWWLKRRYNKDL